MHRRVARCLLQASNCDHPYHLCHPSRPTLHTPLKRLAATSRTMTTSQTTNLWKQRLPVDGQLTDVFGIDPPPGTDPQLSIFIIPGNPGIGSYYIPFMNALQQHLDVPCMLRTVSHLGQDTHSTDTPGYSLTDQIQHKVSFLRQHMAVQQPHAPPIVIMGHSIGAHIAVQAVRLLEQTSPVQGDAATGTNAPPPPLPQSNAATGGNVISVVGLFPFFAVDPSSPVQWRIQQMVQWPGLAGGVVSCVSCLPTSLQKSVVAAYGGLDDEHALHATLSLLSAHQVRNAFVLGQHEFADLATPDIDWEPLQALGSRLLVVAAPKDVWLPESQWQGMQTHLPDAALWWELDQVHAFCVSAERSDQLAQKIARHLHHGRKDEATVPRPGAMQHAPPAGLPM